MTLVSGHGKTAQEFAAALAGAVQETGLPTEALVIRAGPEAFTRVLAQSYADLPGCPWVALLQDRKMDDWEASVEARE